MSQNALARKCQLAGWDLSRQSVAKIEIGMRGVTDREVLKLSDALGVNYTDLFPAMVKCRVYDLD